MQHRSSSSPSVPGTLGEGPRGDLDYPGNDLQASGVPGNWVERSDRGGSVAGSARRAGKDQGPRFAGLGVYGDPADWAPGPDSGVPSSLRFPHPSDQTFGSPGFRGVGSRHYRRLDERIRDDVQDSFCEDPDLDPRNVDVQVEDGVVTLTGSVPDRSMKRRAGDLADRVRGVRDVNNLLRLQSLPR